MKHKMILFIMFALSLTAYILTMKGVAGSIAVENVKGDLDQVTRPLELSPERGRFLLTQSLAKYGSFALSQSYAEAAYPDVGYYNGKFYVFFAPGMSLFALPFYFVGEYFGYALVGAFAISTVFALLNLLILYRLGRDVFKFSSAHSFISPLIFGFASTSWSYSVTLYQHHATTFYILSGVYAVWRYAQKTKHSWVWAVYVWFIYGCAIFIDYPNALLVLPVIIYFFASSLNLHNIHHSIRIRPRWLFLTSSIIFVVIMLAHGYYNLVHYGGWTRLSGSLIGYKAIVEEQLLSGPDKSAELRRLEEEKDPVGFFSEYNFPFGLYTMTISSDRGVFVYYPIFLLGILGIWNSLKHSTNVHKTLLGSAGMILFLYSSFGDPWGGWAFGSRYMIPAMAVLSLYVAYWLATTKYSLVGRVVAFVLFVYSSAISLAGVLTTNAVPPKVEADYLKMKHNFLLNFDYIFSNQSSSIVYNQLLSSNISLLGYYSLILTVVCIVFFFVLICSRRYRYEK